MRQVQGQDPLGAYGAQPFQRMGPPTANPGTTQWNINQACQDVNMRDWIHVNAGQPNLQQRGNQTAGNLCGGGHPCQGQPSGIPPSQPGSFAFTGVPHDDRHREEELNSSR